MGMLFVIWTELQSVGVTASTRTPKLARVEVCELEITVAFDAIAGEMTQQLIDCLPPSTATGAAKKKLAPGPKRCASTKRVDSVCSSQFLA